VGQGGEGGRHQAAVNSPSGLTPGEGSVAVSNYFGLSVHS